MLMGRSNSASDMGELSQDECRLVWGLFACHCRALLAAETGGLLPIILAENKTL